MGNRLNLPSFYLTTFHRNGRGEYGSCQSDAMQAAATLSICKKPFELACRCRCHGSGNATKLVLIYAVLGVIENEEALSQAFGISRNCHQPHRSESREARVFCWWSRRSIESHMPIFSCQWSSSCASYCCNRVRRHGETGMCAENAVKCRTAFFAAKMRCQIA